LLEIKRLPFIKQYVRGKRLKSIITMNNNVTDILLYLGA